MSPDRLSTTFAALADPTRRAILARLASGEASVTELGAPFEMSLPVSHLKVLEARGHRARTDAQRRPLLAPRESAQGHATGSSTQWRHWEESSMLTSPGNCNAGTRRRTINARGRKMTGKK
jgi:hypothetical protein